MRFNVIANPSIPLRVNAVKNLHQKLFWLLILLLPTQLGLHFWPEWSTVFGIRVDYLSPTVYLTDLIVVGVLVSWSMSVVLRARPEGSRNLFAHIRARFLDFARNDKQHASKLFLLAALYLLLTSLFVAENQGVALYKLVKLVELFLLGFYVFKVGLSTVPYPLIASPRGQALLIPLLLSSLLAWFQFLSGHTLGLWILGERTFSVATPGIALANIAGQDFLRPYATFPHPNVLAGYLLVGLVLIMDRLSSLRKQGSSFSLWIPAFAGMTLATLIITFSHSAWLAGLAAIVLYAIPALRQRIQVLARALILTLVVGSVFIPAILLPENFDRPIAQRLELGQAAILMTGDHLLTGVGLNNFIVQLPKYGGSLGVSWWLQPVHNIFLLILAETGLIGFSLLMLLLAKAISKFLIFNFQFSIGLIVVLIIGFLDHYWLTVQQGQLMTAIILGSIFAKHVSADS